MVKDSSMEQKTWRVYSFGKRHVFRLHFKESRKGFCQRGRGRSFHVDGPNNRKGAGTNSGESGARNLEAETSEYEKQSGEYGRVCKVEDNHKDKMVKCL